jgi:hypothetical protein
MYVGTYVCRYICTYVRVYVCMKMVAYNLNMYVKYQKRRAVKVLSQNVCLLSPY